VAVVALLTVSGCALIRLLPKPAEPSAATASADTAHLEPVRRIMAPFGELRQTAVPGTDAVVLAHPGHEELADRLTSELPAALSAVAAFWDADDSGWTHRAVVAVAGDRTEFATLLRRTPASGPEPSTNTGTGTGTGTGTTADDLTAGEIAAAAIADPFSFGTPPTGQRVVFAPDAGDRLTPDQLRTLLRHELTHVATRAHTADDTPQWMAEGFADYAAHRGLGHTFAEIAPTVRAAARSGELPADLPADPAFTGLGAVSAYEQAWTVCAFVAATYDETRLIRLYRAIAAGGQATEDRLLREALGVDRASFLAHWRSWVADRAG